MAEKEKKNPKVGPKASAAMTKDEPKEKKPEKKAKKKEAKHRFSHTHIQHHKNGSHTVTHTPTPQNGGEEVSYAAPDMQSLHQGLDENVGAGGDESQGAPVPPPEAPAPVAAPSQGV